MIHPRFSGLAALVLTATAGFAADANAPADFTLGTNVVAAAPPRFGSNLRDPAQYNNFTNDPGFEAITIKREHVATGGGASYIENVPLNGPTQYSPGTSHYLTLADGFFDGAHVRIYRPSTTGGALTFVREGTVTNYVTDGWRRLTTLPVSVSQYTDTTAAPGVSYEYQVRAVNSSHVVSANHSTAEAAITAAALAGSSSATNPLFANTFFARANTAPAVPSGLTAAAQAGAVFLNWNDNTESDLAGYYIYRRPVGYAPYRVMLDSSGPVVQVGDIYFLEMTVDNAPTERIHDRLGAYALNDTWALRGGATFPYGLPGTLDRDSSTVPPENGGRTSLRLVNPGTHELSVQQPRFSVPQFFSGYYPNLEPGRTYRVDVWMKQSGVPGGAVRFALTQHYSSISHTWTVGAAWQKYSFTFIAPALPTTQSLSSVMIAFNGPGTLWLDNLLIYDDATPAFTLNANAAQALTDFQPGVLRIWTGVDTEMWGVTLEDWTNPEPIIQPHWYGTNGRSIPDDPYKLPAALKICRDTGATPWLIVGSFFTESEWPALIEYLAAPYDPLVDSAATKPWAAKRYAQGQAAPWTDVFPRIHLEYGNELWNGSYQWTFNGGNNAGQFSEYFFGKAKSSPYFASVAGKLRFIVNGWDISTNPTNGFGHAAALAAPSAHYADLANYIGGWESGISVGGAAVSDEGFQDYLLFSPSYTRYYANLQLAARDANAAAGHPYNLAVYEEGPGYANPAPGSTSNPISEAYGKSLAAAVATLDTFLYNSLRGIDPQCYFSFAPGPNWSSHSTPATGYSPHANWLALQMRNRHATGDMVSVATHSTPTVDVTQRVNTSGAVASPAAPNTPLIAVYPFRDGTTYRVFVLSRKLSGATPVTLRLPFSTIASGTIYQLTGNPRANNSTALNITETQQAIGSFDRNFAFSMPAGSISLLEFTGTNITGAANPSVTISRAVGQADPTIAPAVQFAIDFSEPVTGFTASDLLISGTAVAGATPSVALAQGSPFLGTNYVATVANLGQAGDVTINLAAGAAVAADDGAPTLAPTLIDNTIAFAFPAPQDLVLASDDFNVAATASPASVPAPAPKRTVPSRKLPRRGARPVAVLAASPQILQGIASGSGWSQAWQVQNYSASYTDGYKLGSTSQLLFSNLRTLGNYGIGGLGYGVAWRGLNVASFQHFNALGSSPPAIGQNGTTLWMSFLLRKETNDNAPVRVDVVNADGLADYPRLDVGAGFYGGTISSSGGVRYWTLAVLRDNSNPSAPVIDYVRSNVPVVIGQAALLVVKMTFGATDRFDLFVNPSSLGGAAPAMPNATFTTSGTQDILFRSVRFRAGLGYDFTNDGTNNGLNKGSVDELRFGDSFAAVAPALSPQESWRQQNFGSWQNSGTALDSADPDGDGLSNVLEYALASAPNTSSAAAAPQSDWSADRLALLFPRNATATDLTYSVEGSPDLAAWSPLAAKVGAGAWTAANGVTVNDTGSSVAVTDAAAIAPGGKRFLRLRITPPSAVDVFTVPEGALSRRVPQGATTSFGVPLLNPVVYRGAASAVAAATLTTAGATWSANQFAQAGSPYCVAILSGAQTGRVLPVTANSPTGLTLGVSGTNLNAAGFAMAIGDQFELFRGETLATLFGDAASGVLLQGGSAFTADTVQVHNGIRFVSYYFDTARGIWLKIGGDGTRQDDVVLPPEAGLLVARRGPTTALSLNGRVPATARLTRLPGGTANAVTPRFPVDQTLAQSVYGGPGTWLANDSAFAADTINLFNGIRWTAYWKRATDGQWRQLNGDATDQGGLVIPAGSAVLIQKRGSGTGAASFFSQPLPYLLP